MLKFDNRHVFTGYLKQKLSSVNIPTCKIYTREFADHLARTGSEDPRVVESTDTIVYKEDDKQLAVRINYLKGNEVYNYYHDRGLATRNKKGWQKANMLFYDSGKNTPGLTKTLNSPGYQYDRTTHEYLGDYLRFLRDYHDINLMSLYNCFNNNLCNNLSLSFPFKKREVTFSSYDPKYKIYAFPVKLFANYTIAIDCYQGIEICCGVYNTHLYNPSSDSKISKEDLLGTKTYLKVDKAAFNQPILYNKLAVDNWSYEDELKRVNVDSDTTVQLDTAAITRWEVLNHEQDLKMFIKVPASCKSSIVVLEGDFRYHNNTRYLPNTDKNLEMSGCILGKHITTTGEPSRAVKGYKISDWPFGYSYPTKNTDGDATLGLLVASVDPLVCAETYGDSPVISLGPAIALEAKDIWEQDVIQKPSYSEELDCCEINNGAELAYVIKNNGETIITDGSGITKTVKNYIITQDIYLNDPTKIDWETGHVLDDTNYSIRSWFSSTDGNLDKGFSGSINGNGHAVYGLYFASNYSGVDSTGLIPVIKSDECTTIRNLGINYAYLRSSYSNVFVGSATASKVDYDIWSYEQNHSVVNFSCEGDHFTFNGPCDKNMANDLSGFKPISKLQLLAFNTGESYPFADRLIEYLCGSAITPIDEIPDNIKRAQRVMKQNQHHFKIDGLWENKMQKIVYDYLMNSGPIEHKDGKLLDKREGYHRTLGHTSKSTLYDVLGYVDRDAEKWYASVRKLKDNSVVQETIQNVDIYDGLYEL